MEKSFVLEEKGLRIPCKCSVPEDGQIKRLVLGVHGLGGSSMDAIQTGIAEEMELFYSATFRFDFPAHGESVHENEDFTLENCCNTLLAVARCARESFPAVKDLCVFATGFGAYITLLCLEQLQQLPGEVKLVVQTPAVLMHETLLAMKNLSQPTFRAMGKITLRAERPFDVSYSFWKDMQANIALDSYAIPMLILHGEADAYIPMEHIHNFRRLNEKSKLVIIPGTSHQFLEEGAWDMVLDLTRDWFEFEQVLVADWE